MHGIPGTHPANVKPCSTTMGMTFVHDGAVERNGSRRHEHGRVTRSTRMNDQSTRTCWAGGTAQSVPAWSPRTGSPYCTAQQSRPRPRGGARCHWGAPRPGTPAATWRPATPTSVARTPATRATHHHDAMQRVTAAANMSSQAARHTDHRPTSRVSVSSRPNLFCETSAMIVAHHG
jgi:hypothetical protein